MKSQAVIFQSLVLSLAVVGILSTARAEDESTKLRVLILGDSISIGYTPTVQKLLQEEAVVMRPMRDEKKPENCQGT
ncbi:MAG: hypothetical protein KDA65_14460, partial [Planctomycetaceae bacterium]|nr:hypothetical protein [Planctomycetaceae bacterium]